MGLIIKKITLEDYVNKNILYSKQIRGNLSFDIETHHLEKGKILQLYFYREHPRIKEFINANEQKNHLTVQKYNIDTECGQMRFLVNDKDFMINSNPNINIQITEYNFGRTLKDFEKGKVAVLITITFNKETDNSKLINEIKSMLKEEN